MNASPQTPPSWRSCAITAPLRALLAHRNQIIAISDDSPNDLSDVEGEVLCGEINAAENEIIRRPASTADDVVIKLIALAQIVAEGHEPSDTDAGRVLADAQRLLGIGYVHRHLLAEIGAVAYAPLTAFGLAEVQYAIAKRAYDALPDDAEDSDEWQQAEAAFHQAFTALERAPATTAAEFIRKWRSLTHDGQSPVNEHAIGLMVGDAVRLGEAA